MDVMVRSGSSDGQSRTGERLPARINLADGGFSGDTEGNFSGDSGGDANPSRSCSVIRLFSAASFFLQGLLAITYNSRIVCKKTTNM